MLPRLRQAALTSGAAVLIALLAGCASATPSGTAAPGVLTIPAPEASLQDSAPSASPTPTPVPSTAAGTESTPAEVPLLRISGTAVSPDGRSLDVSLALAAVAPLTDDDLAAISAASCDPAADLSAFEHPDARLVAFDVEATGRPHAAEWASPQGIDVIGLLFDGDIFDSPVSSGSCAPRSLVVRPGVGTVKVPVAPEGWKVPGTLPADGAVTLGHYGLRVLPFDEFGQPSGLTEVTDCEIEASSRLDEMALAVAPALGWGSMSTAPEYCLYGRMPADG